MTVRPMKPLKIENTYLFERLRSDQQRLPVRAIRKLPARDEAFSTTTSFAAKSNWQFTPQLSLRLILQYNALLAGTPGVGSPYTYLSTSRQFNADFLMTYLVHPGTAIYVGYNSDLQNLNVVPGGPSIRRIM